jgi:hypothetical protein
MWFFGGDYAEEVKKKFIEMFPKSHMPHQNTVQQLIDKHRETAAADMPRSGRP